MVRGQALQAQRRAADASRARGAIVASVFAALGVAAGAAAAPPFEGSAARDAATPRAVAAAAGGFRLETRDGATFALAGVVAPSAIGLADDAALGALAAATLGRAATLWRRSASRRRDGSLFGHLVVDGVWIQHALVDGGWALAAPGRANDDGAAALLAAEAAARRGRRGLWADRLRGPSVGLRDAAARIGRFVSLRGRGRAVFRADGDPALGLGRGRGDPYLILRGASNADAERFVGRMVTARGWLADRDGPMLEIWSDSQLKETPP